jgi:hypothetical protein
MLRSAEANGVGSRFRATIYHMASRLPENDSRPLPPIPPRNTWPGCLRSTASILVATNRPIKALASQLDGPATYQVALRVTSANSLSAIATTTLTVNNVAPTIIGLTTDPARVVLLASCREAAELP